MNTREQEWEKHTQFVTLKFRHRKTSFCYHSHQVYLATVAQEPFLPAVVSLELSVCTWICWWTTDVIFPKQTHSTILLLSWSKDRMCPARIQTSHSYAMPRIYSDCQCVNKWMVFDGDVGVRWDRVRGGKWWTVSRCMSGIAGQGSESLCDRRQLDWQLMDRTQRRMLPTRTHIVEHWTLNKSHINQAIEACTDQKSSSFFLREFLSLLTRRMSVHLIYKRHIVYASWIS